MKILAIETSCDETSIALIEQVLGNSALLKNKEKENQVYKVLAHETISQINLHRQYGGVYPTLSRREHEKNLIPLLHKVLKDSIFLEEKTQTENLESFNDEVFTRDDSFILDKLGKEIELLEKYPDLKGNTFDFFSKYKLKEKIDYIAVTNGPGLPPALWVGVNFAKIISILFTENDSQNIPIPIYPINHMEGHIIGGISEQLPQPVFASTQQDTPSKEKKLLVPIIEIPKIKYPAICLLISGGHTELVLSKESGKYGKIGETQDDAAGEAYDKVARMLGLTYPGGPEISKLARIGREKKELENIKILEQLISFPRPMIHSKDLNFSFSGLKTSVLYFVQNYLKEKNIQELDEELKIQIATEFEEAVKDVLIYKTKKALEDFNAQSLIVGGGVASNTYLKENFEKLAKKINIDLYYSAKDLATDNALMIALTCANQINNGILPTDKNHFIAIGSKNYNVW